MCVCVCVDLLFRSVDEPMRRHSAQIGGAFLTAVRMGAHDLFVGPRMSAIRTARNLRTLNSAADRYACTYGMDG